jgi:hypothetical protein
MEQDQQSHRDRRDADMVRQTRPYYASPIPEDANRLGKVHAEPDGHHHLE